MKGKYDFVVAGAGVVGLSVARELARRFAGKSTTIAVLEKEPTLGVHSSGRNSGVLHAGIYYSTDSLKAKVCVRGSKLLQEFAAEHGIAVKKTGKVIVASEERELPFMKTLYERAVANGVQIQKITLEELKKKEPEAFTVDHALYSPETAVIDSKKVLSELEKELGRLRVDLFKNADLLEIDVRRRALTLANGAHIEYGHLINCAGQNADVIAHQMGLVPHLRILPFKGIYKKLTSKAALRFHGSIYPAPDPEVPFLGVHITKNVQGEVYVGPTAIPALGRENYGIFKGLSLREAPQMARDLMSMLWRNERGFRKMVAGEILKYRRSTFVKCVQRLAPAIRSEDILDHGKVGVRAQLVDERSMRLVMDFLIEPGPHSTHVLNAVSPGFTSSFAFAEWVVNAVEKDLSKPEAHRAEPLSL